MKARKIVLALLLVVLIVSSALLVVACNQTLRIDLTTASEWSNFDTGIYTISNDSAGKLVMSYDKTDTYQLVKRTMVEKKEDLDKVQTLVIKISADTEAEEPILTLKFEGGTETPEITFLISSTEKTYEWDVSDLGVSSQARLLLFADAGYTDVKGTITISEFYFTSEPVNEENKIVAYQEPAGNPPTTVEWSEITAEDPAVDAGWYDAGRGVYKPTKNSDGTFTVSAQKGKHERYRYEGLWTYIYGANDVMQGFKSFKLTVKGAKGTAFGVKPFDAIEEKGILDEDDVEQTIWVDITSYFGGDAERNFAKTTDATDAKGENKIGIFWQTGVLGVSGEFTIVSAEFSTEAAPIKHNVKEITATDTKADAGWYDHGDGAYTITPNSDGSYKVAYDKGSFGWAFLETYVKGAALKDMTSLTVKVKGESGLRLLVKPYDKKDCWIDLDGTEQTQTFDISGITGVDYSAKELPINVFLAPDTNDITGEFTIYSVEFGTDKPAEPDNPESGSYPADLLVNFNSGWTDADGGHWTIPEQPTDGYYALSHIAGNGWAAVTTTANIEGAAMNYVLWEVKGTAGTVGILSVEFADGVKAEAHFEGNPGDFGKFTGEWQTVAVALDKPRTGNVTVRIFGGFNDGDPAGEIQVRKAQFMYVADKVSADDLDVNGCWLNAVKDSTRNDIKYADGKTTVSYSAPGWDSILAWVDLGEGGYSKLTITFKGLAGHTGIFKFGKEIHFEGNGVEGDNGTFTGEEQTIEFDVSGLSGVVEFRIFLDMNANEANAQGGSVEITKAVFSK